MNTTNIILKDGNIRLAQWAQNFDSPPTVGDVLDIPPQFQAQFPGYRNQATVSKVVWNQGQSIHKIELAAACELEDAKRPVVFLNASLLPQSIHEEVENHLRSRLRLPILDWEESTETQPVLRLHQHESAQPVDLHALQAELHEILKRSSDLVCC